MLGGVTRLMLPQLPGVPPPSCKQALSVRYLGVKKEMKASEFNS